MLLKNIHWNSIRDRFTDEEKEKINESVICTAVCPRGAVIDETKLENELLAKLKNALNIKS